MLAVRSHVPGAAKDPNGFLGRAENRSLISTRARFVESGYGAEAEASLQEIRGNFNAELDKRTVAIRGGFTDSHQLSTD